MADRGAVPEGRSSLRPGLGETGKLERTVHVIRVGTDHRNVRYLAWDPEHSAGEYLVALVLNHDLQVLGSFTH